LIFTTVKYRIRKAQGSRLKAQGARLKAQGKRLKGRIRKRIKDQNNQE
jgi:hypothetical protein